MSVFTKIPHSLLFHHSILKPLKITSFSSHNRLMQKKALQLYVEAEKAGNSSGDVSGESPVEDSNLESNRGNGGVEFSETVDDLKNGLGCGSVLGSRGMRIKKILEKELRPVELKVEDISWQHAGHAGVRGSDGETHFNVEVFSGEFEGKSLVKRHRLIYGLLQDELQCGLHALSIVAKTPGEIDTVKL